MFAATHNLAEEFVIGDSFPVLVDLWEMIIERPAELSEKYSQIWHEQFEGGTHHFNDVRASFNESADPVQFLYLVARCVKNAVRFNKHGHFTQSVDKRRTGMKPERVTRIAKKVSELLQGRTRLFRGDFAGCIAPAKSADFVYLDPPYQGTTYGRDKRYASQLEREDLIAVLSDLDRRSVSYVLSYDGRMGEKTYGDPLPATIMANRLEINAGRSSQATLSGGDAITVESLYVSHGLKLFEMGSPAP